VPARKPATRRAPAKRVEEPAEDGVAIRMVEHALENPAMSGGLLVMGLTAVAIVSNAMFMQSARHPDPLFMTRPAPAVAATPVAGVPIPRPRVEVPPVRVAPPQPAPAIVAEPPAMDRAGIASIQHALATLGIYKGEADGRTGPKTRAAISAYQKAAGMKVTGLPSAELLQHLSTAPVKPAKLPPAPVGPAASAAPAATPAVAMAPAVPAPAPAEARPASDIDAIAAAAEPETLPERLAATATPAETPAATPVASPAPSAVAVAAARRTISVQNALNQIGYGPVTADGMLNDETVNAIRRFELDNGMAITGRIGDGLLNRLVAIGALNPG